jgi:hypothetical protein
MPRLSDEQILLNLVPKNGGAVGNGAIMQQLRWDKEKYWRVRDRLLNDGKVVRGSGKGGSVRRPATETSEPVPQPIPQATRVPGNESDLYEPLLRVLSSEWVREMHIERHQIHFEITAKAMKKAIGGIWTRPDITAVSVQTFQHLPNKYLDIWTFEIKTVDYLDVTAIFEAAAHASRATRSYALLQVPEDKDMNPRTEEIVDRCRREAERLRVGMITFVQPSNFSTWETKVEAVRIDTNPEFLEEFIAQLSDDAKKRLALWK